MPWQSRSSRLLLAAALVAGCAGHGRPEPSANAADEIRTHPEGTVVGTARGAGRPFGVAVSRAGLVYCTLLDAAKLIRTSLTSDSLSEVAVGAVPTDVAFDPLGTTAYVTNQGDQSVGVVDTRTGSQVAVIPLEGDPFRVAVAPDGGSLYATTNRGTLVLIDPRTRKVARSLPLGGNLNGLAINRQGTRIYVGDVRGGVYELDADARVLRSFPVSGAPQGLAVSADGTELYAAGEGGDFIVVRLDTGAEVSRIPLGAGGFGIAVTPDDTQIWITAPTAGHLFVLDRKTRAIVQTIALGGKPRRLAFDRSGRAAVIADEAGAIRFLR
jgi:YVTN family beta-propeller protein